MSDINDEIMLKIDDAANIEKEIIIKKYGEFKNSHEFYGVFFEEFEEANEAIASIKKELKEQWKNIRRDRKVSIDKLEYLVKCLTYESIQMIAIIERLSETLKDDE